MTSHSTILKAVFILLLLLLAGWTGVEIYRGDYLQAVAISGVGSVFLWFASGAARRTDDRDDDAT